MDASQALEHRYNSFINRETPWGFFTGLGDYVDYVMFIPALKKIVDEQWALRDKEYKKRDKIEQQSILEMREVKRKLLTIIKNKKVDVTQFSQDLSFIPSVRSDKSQTVLDQLESFETGMVSISGFFSDNLERFLFDIAANLLRLGYKDDLKEFLVSNKEYEEYDSRINGYKLKVSYNQNGNFIFSKSWPERFEQQDKIESTRHIEPWGAFELLVKFWKARKEAPILNSDRILKSVMTDKTYRFDAKDSVDIYYIAEDLRTLMQEHTTPRQEIKFLNLEDFRMKTATVHFRLMEIIPTNGITEEKKLATQTESDRKIDQLWRTDVNVTIKELREFMEEYRTEREREKTKRQDKAGGKWWKNESRPTYDRNTYTITLEERTCYLGDMALNQQTICETLFQKPIGEYLVEYEIRDSLSTSRGDKPGKRAVYDAVGDVNDKIEKNLGIVSMLEYKSDPPRVRINSALFKERVSEPVKKSIVKKRL